MRSIAIIAAALPLALSSAGAFPYAPDGRTHHTAVWTGSEMIVWGGFGPLDSGDRYEPVTDRWQPTSVTPATPSPRGGHVAVWTGSEMIVWGGCPDNPATNSCFDDGAAYDPATGVWRTLATAGAPSARGGATAVWTGTEMIVWGGKGLTGYLGDGARYDPSSDSWQAMPITGAPAARGEHTAVWTGSLMIVWGGISGTTSFRSGGRFDPATSTWRPTSTGFNVPEWRNGHSAVWTGTQMIVWGGSNGRPYNYLADGGRYDPLSDTWQPIDVAGAPAGRNYHTAVWTGSAMVVWGGASASEKRTGGRYVPASNSWSPTDVPGAPNARSAHTALWTGTEMIVWGARTNTGGRYDPATDVWRPTATAGAGTPSERAYHTAVWTGSQMIVWGGADAAPGYDGDGARYQPAFDAWLPTTSTGASVPRVLHLAFWTGSEMLLWAGASTKVGNLYDPVADAWRATSVSPTTPDISNLMAGVWTGSEMIVWGDGTLPGGRYDPGTDTWRLLATTGAPTRRRSHTAVWTGAEMIVWGGDYVYTENTGARYDPATDRWTATSTGAGVPSPRSVHSAVWTGREMIVWGGGKPPVSTGSGGRYDPSTDSWRPTSLVGAPSARYSHTAVWTGQEMVVWGGGDDWYPVSTPTGGRYDPVSDTWRATSVVDAPSPRANHTALWTGSRMIVWGGNGSPTHFERSPLQSGGIYDPIGDTWSTAAAPFDIVTEPGPDPAAPPRVLGFDATGTAHAATDITAYGATGYGANVGAGDIGVIGPGCILTGPGPGAVYGPQVRAFRTDSAPISKVNYFAYSTLRYGVGAMAIELDGDGYAEIVTAAGPGAVFGPHVRGWDYDASAIAAMPGCSFFAYGTLQYGVVTGRGTIASGTGSDILTMPGPGATFGPQVRAFRYEPPISALAKVSFFAFPAGGTLGGRIDGGDLDGDGWDETIAAMGPGALATTEVRGFDYDDSTVRAMAAVDFEAFSGGRYGAEPRGGNLDTDAASEMLVGRGADPAGTARARGFDYSFAGVTPIPTLDITPYGTTFGIHTAVSPLGF